MPAYLRDEIGIKAEALVIGVRDHGEIWVAGPRGRATASAMDDPQELAEAIHGLGI